MSDSDDKRTPREKLRDSLRENSEFVRAWPAWLRACIDTRDIFWVPPPTKPKKGSDT